ncbi:MAG: cytochrome P450 [Chloroflexales bacterium]|nr:cytochrome P450 [Chloroflexales bacterium]
MTQPAHLELDNLMHPDVLANPYPTYRYLREHDPVHWNPVFRSWFLSRYDDIVAALQHPHLSSVTWKLRESRYPLSADDLAATKQILPYFVSFMQGLDDPEHARQRGLMNKAFSARTVERLRPRVQQLVDELLDRALSARRIELMQDLAFPLPWTIICELLGIPEEGHPIIKASSDALARYIVIVAPVAGQLAQITEALQQAHDYLAHLIAVRRADPQDDLLSAMISAEENGAMLSETEIIVACTMLLLAGHETTTNMIGNGMVALLCHPEQLARLRADPQLITSAVEELLRYDGSVQVLPRVATEDITINGTLIRQGQQVNLGVSAANRDPAQFADPERLDIGRQDGRPLSFGYGMHYCLGAALARLEMQITIGTLLRRTSRITLASDNIQWRPNFVLRGVTVLPLLLE